MIKQGSNFSEKQKDWFSVAAILGILLIRFHQVIFFGHSLSKIFLTAHWDSLFYALRSGQSFSSDSSLCELLIPYRFFVAEYWHHGLPLWNQLNGFGMPLLADPQALPLSPLYAFFSLSPELYTWNILLIIKLAIAAISTYFLCREIQLNFITGLIAALLFIFCPFLQWQIELLGSGFCLTPFVFLLFTKMAKKGSFWNIVCTGIATAIDILSSHPEIAFVTILFASIWTCFISCYTKEASSLLSSLGSSLRHIALTGIIAFGLCAPMLLPFVEYLANCESYKLHVLTAGLSWQIIIANYLFPFQPKASLFFGPLSFWGLLASFVFFDKSNRFTKALTICFFISLIGIIRPFPFDILFRIPPLSMTFATYWLPEYLLFTSILSGLGCNYLIKKLFTDSLFKERSKIFALLAIGIILLIIPLAWTPWHANNAELIFDKTFEPPHFNWKIWVSNTSLALTALLVLFSGFKKSYKWKVFVSCLFIALGFTALILNSFSATPIRPVFKYPDTLPFTANERTDRIFSVGNHLLNPNNNLIYRLPLLQAFNPIFPKGFISFTEACGAQTDQYKQIFSPLISPLLRIASITKIISEQPVLDESILQTQTLANCGKLTDKPVSDFENLLSLSNTQLFYDPKTFSIFFKAKVLLNSLEDYRLCFSVENMHGSSIAYTEPVGINNTSSKQEIICSALIPQTEKHWSVYIRIMRAKDCRFLTPNKIAFGKIRTNNSWLVASSDAPQSFVKINNDRFELVSQHGSILEYRDNTAFKRYFFVKKIIWAQNNAAALSYLKTHTDQLANVAVLEKQNQEQFNSIIKAINKNQKENDSLSFDPGTINESSDARTQLPFATASEFSLHTETKNPSFLIDTDIYYPGWNVYIDGKKSNIFRTDYLFRGIIIPAGKHIIKFAYQPLSLTIGFWLCFITLVSILVLGFRHFLNENNK